MTAMASNMQHTCSCDQYMPSSALLPGSRAAETSTAIHTGLHGVYIEHERQWVGRKLAAAVAVAGTDLMCEVRPAELNRRYRQHANFENG